MSKNKLVPCFIPPPITTTDLFFRGAFQEFFMKSLMENDIENKDKVETMNKKEDISFKGRMFLSAMSAFL